MKHKSVLLNESIENLNIKEDGIYVDCTLGYGGHSSQILKRITRGCLFAFDQDGEAIEYINPPKELLEAPKYGCINIHASLLPEYRGGAPIHKAVMDGKDKTGITIMYMDEKMDSGDILYQKEMTITSEDNTSSMFNKLSILGKEMIGEFLPKLISGDFTRIKQDESKVTYAYNISKEDEKISFEDSASNIFNKIRGLSDIPGGYAFLDGKRIKIFKARLGKEEKGNPGEIINIYDDGIGVMTNDKEIIITDIQLEGKKREEVKSYLNGVQDKNKLIGKKFE